MPANILKDTVIRNAEAKEKPYKLNDGEGLYLLIKHTKKGTRKYWRYDYQYSGKRKTLSLSIYPAISLAEARMQHQKAKKLLTEGIDPAQHKKTLKSANIHDNGDYFQAIALRWFEHMKPTWSESHITRTISYLNRDVFPWIGKKQIDTVTPADVIKIMQRIESRGASDASKRVKQYIGQVFRYAVTMQITDHNPAADIDNSIILKPRIKKHFAAITEPQKVGQLMRDIEAYQGTAIVRAALKLSALVMLRPGELRQGEWEEINFDDALWTIPVKRMKAKTHIKKANQSNHLVPLSRQAIEILEDLHPLTARSKYIFPSARGYSRPLSENGVRTALRTMDYDNSTMTPHGFRGMASSLLNELGFNPDAIERQLAHKDHNQIRAAYNRTEYLEERKTMMQTWADYLDSLRDGADIISFRKKA